MSTRWAGTKRGTVTRATFAYTNHTLLPEALEKWPRRSLRHAAAAASRDHLRDQPPLPRRSARGFPGDDDAARAALAHRRKRASATCAWRISPCVGSHTINGVAALHSELLKQTVLRDFAELWPEKFCNVTNGVTPRRFVGAEQSRPHAADHRRASATAGCSDLDAAARSSNRSPTTPRFSEQWRDGEAAPTSDARRAHRGAHRHRPSTRSRSSTCRSSGIHEYKRQHLNVLHILTLYLRLRRDPQARRARRARSSSAAKRRPAISWPS